MIYKRNILAAGAVALALGFPGAVFGADPVPANVTAAVNSVARPNGERAKDADLKPAEVLTFSEVKSGGVVAEIATGDVYWTRLFSKAVGRQGHEYPVVQVRGFRTYTQLRAGVEKAAAAAGKPAPFDPLAAELLVQFESDYRNVKAIGLSIQSWEGSFSIPDQADVVFTHDAYHDFHNSVLTDLASYPPGGGPYNMKEINRAIYRAMNPGATYVISDYAAAPGAGFSATDSLKRSDPEAVKAEVTAVGFEFVGSSDALANPADDHTKPADSMAKPDRFVLKFRKPRNAPAIDRRPKGEVLATWQHGWIENTMKMSPWEPSKFYGSMYYHADGTLEERCCPPTGGSLTANMLLTSYYWDAQGHNCQYHESTPGIVVCHALETPEALNVVPDTYAFAYLNGFPDQGASYRTLTKGIVFADLPPPNLAEWRAAQAKANTVPLGPNPGKLSGKPAPKVAGYTDSDYLYCRIPDTDNGTAYFSNVILGDFSQQTRYATAFTDYVHSKFAGSKGNATCSSTKDFWQTRNREDVERAADDKTFKTREDTGWHYRLDGQYGFR